MRRYHSSVSSLHITNGDCAAGTLRTFLTDSVLVTCDVLHDGPAPLVDRDVWYDTRARFLADGFGARFEDVRADLERFDRTIADAVGGREIVLWFEHDLFDQLLLIRTLDVLRGPERPALPESSLGLGASNGVAGPLEGRDRRVSLICIDRFPGVERFVGLGQLNAEQLASLYPARQRATGEQFALATEAWRAFRAADPCELLALMTRLASGTADTLPFLHGAIHRLFEEYPSTTNGLSRTADAVLRALASAPLDGMALFESTQAAEPRPFMGDAGFFEILRRLAAARVPLVAIAPATPSHLRAASLRLTDAGSDVLAGRRDAVGLNGVDEWRGGVHLFGQDRSPWRWDAQRETLVS
jgi:hypothetical protein